MTDSPIQPNDQLAHERFVLLTRISRASETPMLLLGLVWLVLLVIDAVGGLSPFATDVALGIWGLFGVQFAIEFVIAPSKKAYLRGHWPTALALLAPAFRVVAITRFLRVGQELGAIGIVGGLNRGMHTLARITGRRGFGHAVAITLIVNAAGAAGMYAFERNVPNSGITDFGTAFWWSAMAITTVGTDYSPKTPAGRTLCLLLATYGFAVFGYLTASIASVFVAQDAEVASPDPDKPEQLTALRAEIGALHADVQRLIARAESAR